MIVEGLFLTIFKVQHVLHPNKTYVVETNEDWHVLEILSSVFSDMEIKSEVFLNFDCGINETTVEILVDSMGHVLIRR